MAHVPVEKPVIIHIRRKSTKFHQVTAIKPSKKGTLYGVLKKIINTIGLNLGIESQFTGTLDPKKFELNCKKICEKIRQSKNCNLKMLKENYCEMQCHFYDESKNDDINKSLKLITDTIAEKLAAHHNDFPQILDQIRNGHIKNLENIDFSNANLQGANLQGVNLQGANLTGANLTGANLQGANLQGANLTQATLVDANLQDANLQDANLQDANLQGANLQRTKLVDADLQRADLTQARLDFADLQDANLQDANLQDANLQDANLQGVNLKKASLYRTLLQYANLQDANLTQATLDYTNLQYANLQGANLQYANLQGANLHDADLQGADLTDAKLNRCILLRVNLKNAGLKNTVLQYTYLYIANLNGANLDGTDISIDLKFFSQKSTNLFLYHPDFENSLLTSIDSIDDKYIALKIKLMNQIIDKINSEKISIDQLLDPILGILCKDIYLTDDKIKSFVDENIYKISSPANTSLVTFSQSKALFLSNYYISKITNNPDYLIQNSAAINQLLQFMHHNTSLSENYNLLITTIFNETPEDLLKAYYDISGNKYEDLKNDMKDGEIYIFYSNPQGGAVFINFDKIRKQEITDDDFANVYFFQNLDRKPSTPPSNSHAPPSNFLGSILNFIIPNAPDAPEAPDAPKKSYYKFDTSGASFAEKYKKYPILDRLFLEFQSNKKTLSLINCLGLPHEYKIHFIKAIENKTYSYDMVGIEQQKELIKVFQMHIKPPHSIGENGIKNKTIGISDVHFNNLCNAYGVSSSSSNEKASLCLALAAMFSRYSSSSIFGQDDNSPIALRNYALALLNKANELDNTLIEVETLQDWREKFLGLNDRFECTAILSDCIKGYIQTKSCDNKWILATFPTAWL